MKATFFTTTAALVASLLAFTASAEGWGGSGDGGWAPTDWSGQSVGLNITTFQAGDAVSDAYNAGTGTNRTGFSETFAEQDLTTDVRGNTILGDEECATCENDTTYISQRVFQRSGGTAYQRSEGGDSSSSHAQISSGAVGQLGSIAERYRSRHASE